MEEEYKKTGHPVLAIILGLLSTLIGIFAVVFFGRIPLIAALVLGAAAIILGILTRMQSGKRGIGGIVWGIIGIVAACGSLTILSSVQSKVTPYVEDYPLTGKYFSDITSKGFLGVLIEASADVTEEDEETQKKISEELERIAETLTKKMEEAEAEAESK